MIITPLMPHNCLSVGETKRSYFMWPFFLIPPSDNVDLAGRQNSLLPKSLGLRGRRDKYWVLNI